MNIQTLENASPFCNILVAIYVLCKSAKPKYIFMPHLNYKGYKYQLFKAYISEDSCYQRLSTKIIVADNFIFSILSEKVLLWRFCTCFVPQKQLHYKEPFGVVSLS